jgi:2-iminobutanoate/2-iminopropanoate deaminase
VGDGPACPTSAAVTSMSTGRSGGAELVHEHLGRALRAAGTDFTHVLKVTVFLTDISDRAAINVVREKFFGTARPASTLVEVSALIRPELRVEIEAVAGIPG